MTAPPLAGRTVALTRPRGGDDALAARLRELGAEVLEAPAIEIAPPASPDALDAALRILSSFGWVAFASVNSVERTVARAGALGVSTGELARPRLAAVGKATAGCISRLLRPPDLVPAGASGAALAAALASLVAGVRVLVPRAEEGRPELVEGLQRAGAEVVAPVAYRTVPAPASSLAPLAEALEEGRVDVVIFASPSAVRATISALGTSAELLARTALAVMGPTTATELRRFGFEPAVQPARSWAKDLADAVATHLARG